MVMEVPQNFLSARPLCSFLNFSLYRLAVLCWNRVRFLSPTVLDMKKGDQIWLITSTLVHCSPGFFCKELHRNRGPCRLSSVSLQISLHSLRRGFSQRLRARTLPDLSGADKAISRQRSNEQYTHQLLNFTSAPSARQQYCKRRKRVIEVRQITLPLHCFL